MRLTDPLVYQPVYAVGAGTIRFTVFDRPRHWRKPNPQGEPRQPHCAAHDVEQPAHHSGVRPSSAEQPEGGCWRRGQRRAAPGDLWGTAETPPAPICTSRRRTGTSNCWDYYGAYKGPFIEPVSQIWAGAGDPSGVTGDGHPNGSVGGDNASTGTVDTENQLRQEGDFSKVKRLLTRESILSGVEFNPPPPTPYLEAGWISNRRANSDRNPRGWIVRDPVALGITGAVPATQTAAGNADPGRDCHGWNQEQQRWGLAWFTQKYGMRFHYNPEQTGESYSTAMGLTRS